MATETTKLTFVEGAAAATPAATRSVIYAKADGLMYSKDDAGVETLMSSGPAGSGIAATIFDAKGDLIVATAADTAARKAAGANGTFLQAQSGESDGLKWASGTVVRVTNNASQALTQNTMTYLSFNTERHDPNGFHESVTNPTRITVPTGFDGNYLIGAHGEATATFGNGYGVFRLNGTTIIGLFGVDTDAGATWFNASIPYPLVATDYVEVGLLTPNASKSVIFNDVLEQIFWLVRLP
jgi:hypothetical protein